MMNLKQFYILDKIKQYIKGKIYKKKLFKKDKVKYNLKNLCVL